MYKVSVIVPVYNAGKYIERCLRSLFEQTLDSIEYIFVDDCSPDDSMKILKRVLEDYPERKEAVKILTHEVNTGQSGARRDGMRLASGKFIIHCDADDWVDTDMYEQMYNKAITDKVEAVCCDIVLEFDKRSQVLKTESRYEDHELMYGCIAPISVEYFSMCNRLVSRDIYERHVIEPFKGVNMWDDVGLSIRVRFHIQSTAVINKPFYHYNRQNETSTTRRPLIDRTREQDLCIRYLEEFFKKESAWEKYSLFLSYVKIHSIVELFFADIDEWKIRFDCVKNDLWKVRKRFRIGWLIKFYTVGYGGLIGKAIWKKWWKR